MQISVYLYSFISYISIFTVMSNSIFNDTGPSSLHIRLCSEIVRKSKLRNQFLSFLESRSLADVKGNLNGKKANS